MFSKKADEPTPATEPRPAPTSPAQGVSFLGDSLVRAEEARRNAAPVEERNVRVLAPRSHWW